jgi:plasmid maintenance system antidote protein VapI
MKEDMEHVGFSQVEFAQRMGYTAKHIHKLIKGEASITADTALKLEKVLSYPSSSPFFEQIPPERSQHAPYPLSY